MACHCIAASVRHVVAAYCGACALFAALQRISEELETESDSRRPNAASLSAGFVVVVDDQLERFGIKDPHMALLDFDNLLFDKF